MKEAMTIQICGTGSGVGKSVISAALCRIFLRRGYRVAPFKSQNMALNSFVTESGGEIGRAQALQAMACRIKPVTDINPILIKPSSDRKAQIILQGKPVKNMSVYEYKDYKKMVFARVKASLARLKKGYEVVVIEGAGSPSEINLKSHDLVNMKIARLARAPVILVGDIDKGGVFAWLIGTLQLMTRGERKMVKGFIINKFRGDKRLLRPGITFLERYTGIKVLGVIPYFKDIHIPEEDSLPVESRGKVLAGRNKIRIGVIYLPHISNFTDFDALQREPDVSLKYVESARDLGNLDTLIIPGTKNTIGDLSYLKKSGLADRICAAFRDGSLAMLIGVCGGYQMLGERVYDPENTESRLKEARGLGILPIMTRICRNKTISQVRARSLSCGIPAEGYEIHHGRTRARGELKPFFEITHSGGRRVNRYDGAVSDDGRCRGTYIHGVFDSDLLRRHLINEIRVKKGWQPLRRGAEYDVDSQIDKLASLVSRNIDTGALHNILLGGLGQ